MPRLPWVGRLRYFGDGFQSSKRLATRRYWRMPVMDGEFLVEDAAGVQGGVGGGNFLILCTTGEVARAAALAAIDAMRRLPNVIMPFPGGHRPLRLQDRLALQGR